METRNLADMTDLEIVGHLQNMRTDLMHSRSIFERGELLVLIGACCDTLAVRGHSAIAIRDLVLRSGFRS